MLYSLSQPQLLCLIKWVLWVSASGRGYPSIPPESGRLGVSCRDIEVLTREHRCSWDWCAHMVYPQEKGKYTHYFIRVAPCMCRRGCFGKHFDKLIIKQWIISSCNHCYYFRDVHTANKDKATRSLFFFNKCCQYNAMWETDCWQCNQSWEELFIDLCFLILLWFSSLIWI